MHGRSSLSHDSFSQPIDLKGTIRGVLSSFPLRGERGDKGEGAGGGGGANAGGLPSGPTVGGALDPDESWADFYRWSLSQPWGSDSQYTGSQQFQQMVDKLRELGLPLEAPAW